MRHQEYTKLETVNCIRTIKYPVEPLVITLSICGHVALKELLYGLIEFVFETINGSGTLTKCGKGYVLIVNTNCGIKAFHVDTTVHKKLFRNSFRSASVDILLG